jgi:hypothetical protein
VVLALAIAIAFTAAAGLVHTAFAARKRLPPVRCACGGMQFVVTFEALCNPSREPGVIAVGGALTISRCVACGAEYCVNNGGPMIPKPLFDAGMRELPAEARALPPRARP